MWTMWLNTISPQSRFNSIIAPQAHKCHKPFRLMIRFLYDASFEEFSENAHDVPKMTNVFQVRIENVLTYYTELNSEKVTSIEDENIWRVLTAFQHQSLLCRGNPCKISCLFRLSDAYNCPVSHISNQRAIDFCGRKKCKVHKPHSHWFSNRLCASHLWFLK